MCLSFFVFTATAPTETYTLSLHDALPICHASRRFGELSRRNRWHRLSGDRAHAAVPPEVPTVVVRLEPRSEEHTSELQSHSDLVCRLLLEKKKRNNKSHQDRRYPTQRLSY